MTKIEQPEGLPVKFQGEMTFGFSGQWQTEVEIQRQQNANESVVMNLLVKPRLQDLQTEVIEYELPESTKVLYPLFDGKNSIWVSDPSAPKIWQFSLDTQESKKHSFDGAVTTFLTQDNEGKIWFGDPGRNQIGFIDPETEIITTKTLPKVAPTHEDNTATFILSDFDGNIWIPIINKDTILKYIPETDSFEEISLAKQSLPFTF